MSPNSCNLRIYLSKEVTINSNYKVLQMNVTPFIYMWTGYSERGPVSIKVTLNLSVWTRDRRQKSCRLSEDSASQMLPFFVMMRWPCRGRYGRLSTPIGDFVQDSLFLRLRSAGRASMVISPTPVAFCIRPNPIFWQALAGS